MDALTGLVLGCAAIASGYQLFQLAAAWRFVRRAPRAARAHPSLPPVTLLKPLKGPGVELYTNLASFCRQDYPDYQIVFGVAGLDDPAVEVVHQLRRDFPACDIALSIADLPGTNRKVANLRHMMRHATHEILLLSDADIRVRPDYIRTMVAPFADPAVGLATCLYKGVGRFGLPSLIESLFINTDFVPMVLLAAGIGQHNACGASIAVRREALDRIGGFAALADHLADDNVLGNRVVGAGYGFELLPYFVDTVLDSRTLGDVWRHLVRWSRTYRVCQPKGWFCSVVTHATLWGCLALVTTAGSRVGWAALSAALLTRLVSLAAIMRLLGERDTLRYLWLVPPKDLVFSGLWLAAFLGRQVTWSGQVLRIQPDGRMVAVTPSAPAPASAAGRPALNNETETLSAAS